MQRLRPWFHVLSINVLAPLVFSLVVFGHAVAQASRTASKTQDISVFGGAEIANPEYGPDNNSGIALGADFTRYFHFPVQPSFEVRANFNRGTYAYENSYLVGVRGAHSFRVLTPYVDFLVGPGDIHYPLNTFYTGDNSTVYNFGGGLEAGLFQNFSLKLDLQKQRWNTGTYRFQPVVGVIGVTYHIPFRPKRSGYGRD